MYSTKANVEGNDMGKLRVAAYTRVSTKKDEQATSLETQKMYYQDFIESHENWEFVGIYSDSYTGTKLNRKGFMQMLRLCGITIEGSSKDPVIVVHEDIPTQIDLIVVKNTSRFARSKKALELIDKLKQQGVYVYFESIGKDTSEVDNEFIINVLLIIDENYSKSLSKNIRQSYVRAIENRGTIFSNSTLFGYKRVGKGDKAKLVPESQEHIDIINKIFEWYIQGEGFRVIANKVDKAGFTSKKKRADGTYAPIGKHGIKGIITNERYMGYVQVPIRSGNEGIGKIERKEGNYKLVKTDKIVPIVSEETFKKAYDVWNNKPLTKDNRGKKPHSSKYSKYLICANCKCHFIKAEGHNGKSLYVCSHKRNVGATICKMPYLTEQFLDEQLETLAKGVLVQDDRARLQSLVDKIKHFKLMYIYDYAHTDNTQKLQQLKEQIAEKERKFNAVMDMVGELDKDVIKRQSERYNKELTELEAELEELEATDDKFKFHIGVCDDFIKRANELTLPAKYTAENILEHTTYIEVMQLPNQTDRIQSKTNNVELEVITKASGLIASLDNDFMDSIGEYPACLSEFYFSDDIESLEQWYANSGFVF